MSIDQSTSVEDQLGEVRRGLTRLGRLQSSRRIQAGMTGAAGAALPQQAMHVLLVLGDRDPLPMGDLARAARMDAGAVSRQVRLLEESGLAERSQSPYHRSVVLVVATPEGREAARRFEQVRNSQLSRALADWSDEDRADLGRLLVRLVDDLQSTPYLSPDAD